MDNPMDIWNYLFGQEEDFLKPDKVIKSLIRKKEIRESRKSNFLDMFKGKGKVLEETKRIVSRLLKSCEVKDDIVDLEPLMKFVHPLYKEQFSLRISTAHEKFVSQYTTKSNNQVTLVLGEKEYVGVTDKKIRSKWDCMCGRKNRRENKWVFQIDLIRFFSEILILSEVRRYYDEKLKDLSLEECLDNVVFKKSWDRELNRDIRVNQKDEDYKIYLDLINRPYSDGTLTHFLEVYKFFDGRVEEVVTFNRIPVYIIEDILEEYKVEQVRDRHLREVATTYATSYMDLKNVPQKYIDASKVSSFSKRFGYVEYDPDVELSKMDILGKEFEALMGLFRVDISDYELRFRKLGHHKAIGLYYPQLRCLCVDIRAPKSYIHEFFHLLDYYHDELSMKSKFYEIRIAYEQRLREGLEKVSSERKKVLQGNSKYNLEYYLTPTEIFARCGEIYSVKFLGIQNSLVESEFNGFEYDLGEELEKRVKEYFDTILEDVVDKEVSVCSM